MVLTLSLHKFRVIGDGKRDIQIAIRAAIDARATVSRYFDGLSVFNAGRNGNSDVFSVYSERLFIGFIRIEEPKLNFSGVIFAPEFHPLSATRESSAAKHGFKKFRIIPFRRCAAEPAPSRRGGLLPLSFRLFKLLGMLVQNWSRI